MHCVIGSVCIVVIGCVYPSLLLTILQALSQQYVGCRMLKQLPHTKPSNTSIINISIGQHDLLILKDGRYVQMPETERTFLLAWVNKIVLTETM